MTPASILRVSAIRIASLAILTIIAGCDRHTDVLPSSPSSTPTPGVVFDTGRGTGQYDQMTYARYFSDVWFTPRETLPIAGIRPEIFYCNGSSGFIAFIRDEHYAFFASEAGLVDGTGYADPKFLGRSLDQPLTLQAGVRYRITLEVWTTKSVGIFTTGSRTSGVAGQADYEVIDAHSDTADHLDRGGVAFELIR